MRIKYLLVFSFALATLSATAQLRISKPLSSDFVKRYVDSLAMSKHQLDSQSFKGCPSDRMALLFMPATFYHSPAARLLRYSNEPQNAYDEEIDRALMNMYLNRPDLITIDERTLTQIGLAITPEKTTLKPATDIIDKVAPTPAEPLISPVDVVVKKPNFWTFGGDYYLQFLQNYISSNWYKGGESNYSMVGSVTIQANYNNKQKVKWDNKLELKLGYQTTRGDTIHRYKSSEDLIRYTGKLGLQATKRWYYTLQLIANTQFTHGFKNNDPRIYSGFMSPFNLNMSLGMDYNVDWFKSRLKGTMHIAPLAGNFRYVRLLDLSQRYGLDEGKHTLVDYGSEFTVDLNWKLSEMIKWRMRIYGYTTYRRAELEWENTIAFQFNKYFSTNLFIYPRFDDGTTPDHHHGYWQLKEYASIGYAYSF